MVDKEKIEKLLKKHFDTDEKITIADDGRVSTSGAVQLLGRLKKLPVQFDKVGNGFYCSGSDLITLAGCPIEVGGRFDCSHNKLKTLEGAPKKVNDVFACINNLLESFEGFPEAVGGYISAHDNKNLKSLKGLPESFVSISLNYSANLPLLRLLGARRGVAFAYAPMYVMRIEEVINEFAGQGKAGVLKCSHALLTLEKELQKEDSTVSLRANIKW